MFTECGGGQTGLAKFCLLLSDKVLGREERGVRRSDSASDGVR